MLACDVVQLCNLLSTLQRCLVPPFSGLVDETNGYFRKEQEFLLQSTQTGCGVHPASCAVGTAFFGWRKNAGASSLQFTST
jgi:hypothetical protein